MDATPDTTPEEAAAPAPTFAELGVDERLVKALADQGILRPFAIQALSIADALAGRDVCGKAKTGSGKTLAFGLSLAGQPGRSCVLLKELARLHLLAQERAQESERLTEEVTRNMPTGLLLVNATGAISSHESGGRRSAGHRPLAIPLVQGNSGRRFGRWHRC